MPSQDEPQYTTEPDGLDDRILRADLKSRMFGTDGPPVRIGRYSVVGRIGSGGMAVVYAARDEELERKIAVKLLLPGVSSGAARMQREAKAMARLAHPNVATVHEVGTWEGRVYLAMEYVEGQTLRRWLEDERPLAEIYDAFLQAARGLQAAHAAGIVHRDFKPDNILLGNDGRVRVADFGLAREGGEPVEGIQRGLDDAAPLTLTRTGQFVGTPAYMAPEQFLGESVDARTDQYAFCVALFEAMFGARPFSGDLAELVPAVVKGPAPRCPPDKRVPPHLRHVIERGLAREPDDRHPSFAPIVAALERAKAARPRRRWVPVVGIAIAVGTLLGAGAYGKYRARERRAELPVLVPIATTLQTAPVEPRQDAPVALPAVAEADLPRPVPRPHGACPPWAPPTDPTQAQSDVDRLLAERDTAKACQAIEAAPDPDETLACRYDAFCRGTPFVCPSGTKFVDGEGCTSSDRCEAGGAATDEEACETGSVHCCIGNGIKFEFEALDSPPDSARHDELMRKAMWFYAQGCRRGDATSCWGAAVGLKDAEPRRSTALWLRGCNLGYPQACFKPKTPAPASKP